MGSIWNSGSGFRLNHAYSRMLQFEWKPEAGDVPAVPLSLKLTYGRAGAFFVEVLTYLLDAYGRRCMV